MPFQSEKQRRYLHANHPEIAKRWERDYAHGGILDINESEEIIDDGGNEIELTDYNAAFDDPNDLSTGVKSLFQAKDGGTPRRRYFTGAYGGGGADQDDKDSSSSSGGHPHGGVASQYSGSPKSSPSTGSGRTRIQDERQEDFRQQQMRDLVETGPGSPTEKYDTQAQHLVDTPGDLDFNSPQYNRYKSGLSIKYAQENYDKTLAAQKAKLKKMGKGKLGGLGFTLLTMLAMGIPLGDALRYLPKTISLSKKDLGGIVSASIPVMKAKKELITSLENHKGGLLKDVDINNPNEMVNLEQTTDFIETRDRLTKLTTTPEIDDTKGGGIELPPQLGGPSTEEMAIEYDWLGGIRERQAQKKAYDEKIERERLAREKPIVSGTEMDIIALGNSGGLANLFRVKNQ